MRKWFDQKSISEQNGSLPGDGLAGNASFDEIEKTRQDIMLARLESLKTGARAVEQEKIDDVCLEVGSAVPLTECDVADDVTDAALAGTDAVEAGEVQELEVDVRSEPSSVWLSFTTLHEGVDPVLVEEIMTSIVLADIAGHRQGVL